MRSRSRFRNRFRSGGNIANTDFVSVWKTDNAGASSSTQIFFSLHASGTYDFNIDWGDGNSDDIAVYNDPLLVHTYSSAGTYTVTVKGQCEGFTFSNSFDSLKILKVMNWGTGFKPVTLASNMFSTCGNLTIEATDILDLSLTTSMFGMFNACLSLGDIPNIGSWSTGHITNMFATFYQAFLFTGDVGSWDVSSVTDLSYLMYDCQNQNSSVENWDVSAALDMNHCFWQNTSFKRDLGNWKPTSCLDFTNFLQNADINNPNSATNQTNYDSLLNGWNGEALKSAVNFNGGNSKYSVAGSTARANIISSDLWTIADGGPA